MTTTVLKNKKKYSNEVVVVEHFYKKLFLERNKGFSVWLTLWLVVKETCVHIFWKKLPIVAPQKIADYECVGLFPLEKESFGTHRIYTYQKPSGDRAVAKIWQNRIKNYDYYMTQREAVVSSLLEKVSKSSHDLLPQELYSFSTLKLVAVTEGRDSFAMLTEYFNGENLRTREVNEQVEVYLGAVRFLNTLEKKLTPHERKCIQTRTTTMMVISHSMMMIPAMLFHMREIRTILGGSFTFIRSIPALIKRRSVKTFVHRALNTKNIIISSDNRVKIIDVGNIVLGDVLYDLAITVTIEWHNVAFRERLLKEIDAQYLQDDQSRKTFYGLLAYHTIHTLVMPEVYNRRKRYMEILKYILKQQQKTTFLDMIRVIRARVMRIIRPKSKYSLFPISTKFGFDRGTPIDRYYIELFMQENAQYVRGRCLEIGNSAYTVRYGGDKVTQSDVFDYDAKNTSATIHGDLRLKNTVIADDMYDCIILTHTIGVIDDHESAVKEVCRILKPGGTLLVTASSMGVAQDPEHAFWRYTPAALKYLFGKYLSHATIAVSSYGNVLAGQAFWVGLSAEELSVEELSYNDPHYPIIATAVVTKKHD